MKSRSLDLDKDPTRNSDPAHNIVTNSRPIYRKEAEGATQDLMAFLNGLNVDTPSICVTYFDEFHDLGILFQILLRQISNQALEIGMWYVFMGTKSNISYYSPLVRNCMSSIVCVVISH